MTTCKTRLLGAIGYPNRVARTPISMSAFAEAMGLDYAYLLFEFPPEQLDDAVKGLKALGAAGFNVTMPYKQAIIPYLDEIDEEAAQLNAVNTVMVREGRLYGYNTDYYGFRQSLKDAGICLQDKKITVLGAGAVSGPVSLALCKDGAQQVTWLNRTLDKARLCAEQMNKINPGTADFAVLNAENLNRRIRESDLIVDITPVGMATNAIKEHEFDASLLDAGKTVYHVVYAPWETPILRTARERGAKAINGARMSLLQAKRAFEIWTNSEISAKVLEKALMCIEKDVKGI